MPQTDRVAQNIVEDVDGQRLASALRYLASLTGLFLLYFLAGKLGLSMAFLHASASPVWPPTGIAFAALLVLGWRIWPAIFLGAFFVNLTTQGTVATSLAIAAGNTLEALAGAFLVERFAHGRRAFDRPADVAKYSLLAAPAAAVISPTAGVGALAAAGFAPWADFWDIWLTWWLGDTAGAVIVAPALILWANQPRLTYSRRQLREAALLLAALAAVGVLAFGAFLPEAFHALPVGFLGVPLVVWAALRLGPRESATTTLLLSSLAIYGSLAGVGPFGAASPNDALLLLQAFMAVVAAIALPLAAVERQRRIAQASLQEAHDDLERRVRERTSDLEAAVRELQTFTYSVAHDLRGPLRAIDGYAQILIEEQAQRLGPEATGQLGRIKASSNHLGEVIEALLEFARLGRSQLHTEAVDLSAAAQTIAEGLREREPLRSVEVVVQPGLRAKGDPNLLSLVLQNLLQNAWKFTRDRPAARVEFGVQPFNGSKAFYVRDNGVGFDMSVAGRLFVPFQRLHPQKGFEGIGIGLVTAERIVQRHGGRIWAEGQTDRGATFYFTLGE